MFDVKVHNASRAKALLTFGGRAQMKDVSRRVAGSQWMKKMHFVSSETLHRTRPDGLAGLGLIPPFPNSFGRGAEARR